jgi:hypothetical protein
MGLFLNLVFGAILAVVLIAVAFNAALEATKWYWFALLVGVGLLYAFKPDGTKPNPD